MWVVELDYLLDNPIHYIEGGHDGYVCREIERARRFDKVDADTILHSGLRFLGFGDRRSWRLVKVA